MDSFTGQKYEFYEESIGKLGFGDSVLLNKYINVLSEMSNKTTDREEFWFMKIFSSFMSDFWNYLGKQLYL